MAVVSIKQLLKPAMRPGHQARRWRPQNGEVYLHPKRNGIYIIDKDCEKLDEAYSFVRDTATAGGLLPILFVGTKRRRIPCVGGRHQLPACTMSTRWLRQHADLLPSAAVSTAWSRSIKMRKGWHFRRAPQEGSCEAGAGVGEA